MTAKETLKKKTMLVARDGTYYAQPSGAEAS